MNTLRTSHLLATLLLVTAACKDGGDDDKDTDTDDTNPTCVSGIAYTFPEQSASTVFYRTAIEVGFNQAENTTSTLTLEDGAGATVAGTVSYSADGKTAYFETAAPLSPSTQYTLTVEYSCDKTAEITFTTSDTGAAIDASSLVDKVYSIDIFSGRITEPPGVGDLLAGLLAGQDPVIVLVSPTGVDEGGSIEMLGALGEQNGTAITQDVCTPSIEFPFAADYSENPFFSVTATNFALEVEGFSIEIASLELSGAFSPTGDRVEGLSIRANADTRPLVQAFGEDLGLDTSNPAALCDFVSGLLPTVTCQNCTAGADPYCLTIAIDSVVGDQVPGLTGLDLIDQAAIDANPACAE